MNVPFPFRLLIHTAAFGRLLLLLTLHYCVALATTEREKLSFQGGFCFDYIMAVKVRKWAVVPQKMEQISSGQGPNATLGKYSFEC